MDTLLLILGIIGILIGLVLTIAKEKGSFNQRTLISLVLISSIFLVGKEIISHIVQTEGAKNKNAILDEIKNRVVNIEEIV